MLHSAIDNFARKWQLLIADQCLLVALAWAFVIARIIHAYIHLGPNDVRWRSLAYIIGVVCLFAFWVMLFLRIYADA